MAWIVIRILSNCTLFCLFLLLSPYMVGDGEALVAIPPLSPISPYHSSSSARHCRYWKRQKTHYTYLYARNIAPGLHKLCPVPQFSLAFFFLLLLNGCKSVACRAHGENLVTRIQQQFAEMLANRRTLVICEYLLYQMHTTSSSQQYIRYDPYQQQIPRHVARGTLSTNIQNGCHNKTCTFRVRSIPHYNIRILLGKHNQWHKAQANR